MLNPETPFWASSRPFVIDTNDDDLATSLTDRLRDLRERPPAIDGPPDAEPVELRIERSGPSWLPHPWSVWRDGEPCEQTVADDYILPYVLWEVTRLVLESAAPPVVPMHSAALVHDGRAIALVGPSHAGKSTLAAWLTRSGWGFLTDEVALLDTTNPSRPVVQPFWRPIGVRQPGPLDEHLDLSAWGAGEVLVPASELGALAAPAPLVAVAFPSYQSGTEGVIEAVQPATALTTIVDQLPNLARDGRPAFRSLAAVMSNVPAFSISVDDLGTADAQLRSLLDDVTTMESRTVGAAASEIVR